MHRRHSRRSGPGESFRMGASPTPLNSRPLPCQGSDLPLIYRPTPAAEAGREINVVAERRTPGGAPDGASFAPRPVRTARPVTEKAAVARRPGSPEGGAEEDKPLW